MSPPIDDFDEIELPEVRIRSVTRQELQCDLCEWRYLVPEHEGVWAVVQVADLHWEENHAQ
jgi:hypothetical protein